ncbi:hypothetical protein [Streptomyces glaucus]|uniref:Uncharacterized protein n=1 Tax=Streptomyces glaucus TaxID=284029 RepID=A0ABN3JWV4_9ACTN
MPDFSAATERLLRTIAQQGDTGAAFVWETGGYYRLAGTDYRVARRTFFPLTDEAGPYVTGGNDDTVPVKLTARGHEWIRQHPVPRGSRGPSYRAGVTRRPPARRSAAADKPTAYGVVKGQFEESGMRSSLSPIYARAVLAMHDLETADQLEAAGFPEAAEFLRSGRQSLVDEAFGPEDR